MTNQYSVSIVGNFEAESIHDAVENFLDWLRCQDINHSSFRVDVEDRTYIVDDGYGGAVYQIGGPPDGESG